MTVVAHLSDPHLVVGPLAAEPARALHRALGQVLAQRPRPDCVVISGDLVDRGSPEEYRALHEILRRFPLPLHLVAGNHDVPEALVAEFGGTPFLAGGHRARYVADHDGFALAVLDSSVPGEPGGRLGEEQGAWLRAELERRPGVPVFVVVHHPPLPVGIPFLDGMRLADADVLAAAIAGHDVVRVLAGHVHRPVTAAFAGTVLTTAPSVHVQTWLTGDDGLPGVTFEPTSFLLHRIVEGTCVTHTVQVSHAAARTGLF